MVIETLVTGFAIYYAIAYVLGFLWILLETRVQDGRVRDTDVNEALIIALFAFLWLPISTTCLIFRCLRSMLLWVFNDLF